MMKHDTTIIILNFKNHYVCMCVCVCGWTVNRSWPPPSIQPSWCSTFDTWSTCVQTHTISHSHTNTHVLTFSIINKDNTVLHQIWLEMVKNESLLWTTCNHIRCKMKVNANFNHWEQKTFAMLICGNWTGSCDSLEDSLDPEFFTV